jgi:SAM-dependent methyltransferase
MKSLKEQFIEQVVSEVVAATAEGSVVRIMDVGCGTACYVPALLEKFPTVEYVGVEPIAESYAAAEKNLAGLENAKVHFQLGYDSVPDEMDGSFDLVFSLSVLEHIKHLERFLALSAKYVQTGGVLMHRYDLGHALHTHSNKERLHVWLGNNFPQILPERQFVRYVPEAEVRSLYQKLGVTPTKTTYHQMPSHKRLEKFIAEKNAQVIEDLFTWEMQNQTAFMDIPLNERERLFPAIAVWGIKD